MRQSLVQHLRHPLQNAGYHVQYIYMRAPFEGLSKIYTAARCQYKVTVLLFHINELTGWLIKG